MEMVHELDDEISKEHSKQLQWALFEIESKPCGCCCHFCYTAVMIVSIVAGGGVLLLAMI